MYINEKLGDATSDLLQRQAQFEADFNRRVEESWQRNAAADSQDPGFQTVQGVARTIQAVTILYALAWVGGVGVIGYWLLRKK